MPRPALAATRALQVIDLLVLHGDEHLTLTDISRHTGINPASTHALLQAMCDAGYVRRHSRRKTYALGPALVATAGIALEQTAPLREACEHLDELASATSLEAMLTCATTDDILVVAKSSFTSRYGAVLRVGHRLPLAPPVGAVFLAWATDEQVERWLARSGVRLSPADIERHRAALRSVRARRYAATSESEVRRQLGDALAEAGGDASQQVANQLSSLAASDYHLTDIEPDGVYEIGMLAAPIFDGEGEVAAALVLSGFAPGRRGDEVLAIADRLVGDARLITKRTQGRNPTP